MAYSDFTLKQVQQDFHLKIIERRGIFSTLSPVKISDYLAITLDEKPEQIIGILASMMTQDA
jgi:hypothetical protein